MLEAFEKLGQLNIWTSHLSLSPEQGHFRKNIKSLLGNQTQGGQEQESQSGQGGGVVSQPQAQEDLSLADDARHHHPPASLSDCSPLPVPQLEGALFKGLGTFFVQTPLTFLGAGCRLSPTGCPPFQASSPRRTRQMFIFPFLPRNSPSFQCTEQQT